jgi:hypothetical protein
MPVNSEQDSCSYSTAVALMLDKSISVNWIGVTLTPEMALWLIRVQVSQWRCASDYLRGSEQLFRFAMRAP